MMGLLTMVMFLTACLVSAVSLGLSVACLFRLRMLRDVQADVRAVIIQNNRDLLASMLAKESATPGVTAVAVREMLRSRAPQESEAPDEAPEGAASPEAVHAGGVRIRASL